MILNHFGQLCACSVCNCLCRIDTIVPLGSGHAIDSKVREWEATCSTEFIDFTCAIWSCCCCCCCSCCCCCCCRCGYCCCCCRWACLASFCLCIAGQRPIFGGHVTQSARLFGNILTYPGCNGQSRKGQLQMCCTVARKLACVDTCVVQISTIGLCKEVAETLKSLHQFIFSHPGALCALKIRNPCMVRSIGIGITCRVLAA
mmetsp:Transcript_129930/g.211561  ORF Transcript_129930/g.211561 Transcript_129930/m.211561 type:complete len:202 (-) Transcript_129930:811-1416(-)